MAMVSQLLRNAISQLEAERRRLDAQIQALQGVVNGGAGEARSRRRRRGMSAAARQAVSKRMKAYWAKRHSGKKGTAK